MNIVLASGSPRRQQFLRDLGLSFQVITANIDESPRPDEAPAALVERLARAKARAVAHQLSGESEPWLIVAADTIVALDGQLLGKPENAAEATAMLKRLRNRVHQVLSGFTLLASGDRPEGREYTQVNVTDVYMRNYTHEEIEAYVASRDPLDKAGAYAIQHPVFAPGERLEGCVSGVMGLPLADLVEAFNAFGLEIKVDLPSICQKHATFRCCQWSAATTGADRFSAAIARFDAANAEDPNSERDNGKDHPKELLYGQRMTSWLNKIAPDASEAVKLAARCQHIRRWTIPRGDYPDGKAGYKRWRSTLAKFHAATAGEILRDVGYEEAMISRVQTLLRKEKLKRDPEVQLLEDVICLVFLEHYFADFAAKHDEDKLVDIVRKTWRKMSQRGHEAAMTIKMPPETERIVQRALAEEQL